MLLARASSITTVYINTDIYSISGVKHLDTDNTFVDVVDQWTLLDLGVMSARDYLPLDTDDPTIQSVEIVIKVDMAAVETFDVDAVLFLPTEEQIIAVPDYDFNPNTINTYIDGRYKNIVSSDFPVAMARQGTLWTVEPGTIMTRYVWAIQEYDSALYVLEGNHDPTIAAGITLSIWPRTRHLLVTG